MRRCVCTLASRLLSRPSASVRTACAPALKQLRAASTHTPIKPLHPEQHKMVGRILGARQVEHVLDVWDTESDRFGWYTACLCLNRISKLSGKPQPEEARLAGLLDLMLRAVEQGTMTSAARMGHVSDDLEQVVTSLHRIGLGGHAVTVAIERKLGQEKEDPHSVLSISSVISPPSR